MQFSEQLFKSHERKIEPDRKLLMGPRVNTGVLNTLGAYPGTFCNCNVSCANTTFLVGAGISLENSGLRAKMCSGYSEGGNSAPGWLSSPAYSVEGGMPLFSIDVFNADDATNTCPTGLNVDWSVMLDSKLLIPFQAGIAKVSGSGLLVVVEKYAGKLCLDRLLNGRIVNPLTITKYIRAEIDPYAGLITNTVSGTLPPNNLDTFRLLDQLSALTGDPLPNESFAFTANARVDKETIAAEAGARKIKQIC